MLDDLCERLLEVEPGAGQLASAREPGKAHPHDGRRAQ